MSFHNFTNTAQFQYTARDFKKNGGMYTRAPKGSRDYFQFWEEEEKRCLYGYKCGDLWIPGRFYHYLNHFPIARVPEKVMLQALEERRSTKTGRAARQAVEKILDFPAFWEIAYEWYMFKHIAWYGGEFMGIQSPGNRHLCTLKTCIGLSVQLAKLSVVFCTASFSMITGLYNKYSHIINMPKWFHPSLLYRLRRTSFPRTYAVYDGI